MEIKKPIHLLYVPTIFCNMGCEYCYLGAETDKKIDLSKTVESLELIIKKFTQNGYIPYNISFHGGEVTTLPSKILESLLEVSQNYYKQFNKEIKSLGYKPNPIHIKTNLYNFHQHYNLFVKYKVSISGSVDLPLFLHQKYRVDKNGNSTLKQIIDNLKLLTTYPHNKKITCVVTKEHLKHIDEFIDDINYIHNEIGLDMNNFTIMFSFDSVKNNEKFDDKINGTKMLNQDEQVVFYKKIYKTFEKSNLTYGLKNNWFKEFTPDFCCSAVNCGNKFFLIQSNGQVYSCPRGQNSTRHHYGDIFQDDIETIISNGWKKIESNENRLDICDECLVCEYLPYCNMGCVFVRGELNDNKSYTCKLQKEIYKNDSQKYPPYQETYIESYIKKFLYQNKTHKLKILPKHDKKTSNITDELYDSQNSIETIISNDKVLQKIYSDELFILEIDNIRYKLSSQVLKNKNIMVFLDNNSQIYLYLKEDIFSINSTKFDEVNNYLHLMILRDTPVIYGDEKRTKQEHLFDYSIYKNSLLESSTKVDDFYRFNLRDVFMFHKHLFQKNIKNNLFFTSKTMREYHYTKHKKNAFYHIQAINLPFSNLEFYWIGE